MLSVTLISILQRSLNADVKTIAFPESLLHKDQNSLLFNERKSNYRIIIEPVRQVFCFNLHSRPWTCSMLLQYKRVLRIYRNSQQQQLDRNVRTIKRYCGRLPTPWRVEWNRMLVTCVRESRIMVTSSESLQLILFYWRRKLQHLRKRILFWLNTKSREVFQQKMEFKVFSILVFILIADDVVNAQESILDFKFGSIFRIGRETINMFIQPRTFSRGLELNIKNNRVQQQFSNDTKFFCDINGPGARSKVPPKSVHRLRPGDIDVIGAIGDSLTAGNGVFALDVLQVLLEGRGASWSIGGQKTWRNFLTLPNMLKEFNPKLYGYSIAEQGTSAEKSSRFNVAEAGVRSDD